MGKIVQQGSDSFVVRIDIRKHREILTGLFGVQDEGGVEGHSTTTKDSSSSSGVLLGNKAPVHVSDEGGVKT